MSFKLLTEEAHKSDPQTYTYII